MQLPGGSKEKVALAAVSDQGRWEATRPQAMPSRMRYLALSRMGAGMDDGLLEVEVIQWQSCPVIEDGSEGSCSAERGEAMTAAREIGSGYAEKINDREGGQNAKMMYKSGGRNVDWLLHSYITASNLTELPFFHPTSGLETDIVTYLIARIARARSVRKERGRRDRKGLKRRQGY